jgi:hypothetical protein
MTEVCSSSLLKEAPRKAGSANRTLDGDIGNVGAVLIDRNHPEFSRDATLQKSFHTKLFCAYY